MSTPSRTASSDADSNIRKRVCKACDRCRLKKSKCDGASPCSRCRADNAICVFGERKKSHDKVYPKGYVEMLEQQQAQLVAGLRELYRRLNAGESWPGSTLPDASNGQPLTHDILERLNLLHMQTENHGVTDGFEEDTELMQQKLIESGASLVRRRGSISSNSDHSHHEHDHHSPLSYDTPSSARSSQFSDAFPGHRAPPTPPMSNSPFSRPSQLHSVKPVGTAFPQMVQSGMDAQTFMRPSWTSPSPAIVSDDSMDFMTYESPMSYDPMMYPAFGTHAPLANQVAMQDWNDPIDMDFSNFIATAT